MTCARALVCLLLPPAAVLDKGCGAFLVTLVLTIVGWVPGILAAVFFCTRREPDPPGEIRVRATRRAVRDVDSGDR